MKMKINKSIWQFIGWFIIVGIFCLGIVTSYEFIRQNDFHGAMYSVFLFVMVLFILVFVIVKSPQFNNKMKSILIGGLSLLLIGVPLLITYYNYDEYQEASESKYLGEYDLFGDKIRVHIKYIDREIFYQFSAEFKEAVTYNSKTYTLYLKDYEGFTLKEIEIKDYITQSYGEGSKKSGLIKNGSEYMSFEKYSVIDHFITSVR